MTKLFRCVRNSTVWVITSGFGCAAGISMPQLDPAANGARYHVSAGVAQASASITSGQANGNEVVMVAGECGAAPGFFRFDSDVRDITDISDESRQTAGRRRAELVKRIHAAGERLGVAPHLGEGIAWTESRFDPEARSRDGSSFGAFQLTRRTASVMRKRLVRESAGLPVDDEALLGIGYLRYLSKLFSRKTVLDGAGNTTTPVLDCAERWRFAIAAYNAGEGRVAQAQRRAKAVGLDPRQFDQVRVYLPPITQRYVDSVMTFAGSQIAARALSVS
jgi:hypothetical protein